MYLKKIVCENMGPILVADITPGFHPNGNPKPLVIVGKNGTGKSILISNIVDSFFEFGNQAYNDIAKKSGVLNLFFKIASDNQIRLGKKSMICHLEYEIDDKRFPSPSYTYYQEYPVNDNAQKQANDIEYFNRTYGARRVNRNNGKDFTTNKTLFQNEFSNNTFIYFPPERFFIPYWMGTAYSTSHDYGNIKLQDKITNELHKPIIAYNPTEDNTRWIIDVLTDAKAEIEGVSETNMRAYLNLSVLSFLERNKKNIEKVLSCVLDQEVLLRLGLRNSGKSRLNILSVHGNQLIAPTIDALSTGQMILLNMFLTIIRYAEKNDLTKCNSLQEIKGIVVIDEIELHLHSDLQGSVLPRLIQMFPKVQFIITSHSPLFLLGMQDVFSDDGFDIVEMPDGNKIKAESFSEFRRAYEMVASTQLYREDIARKIKETEAKSENALIITEGSSDWKHMKRAWNKLKDSQKYIHLKDAFVFWEYEPIHKPQQSNLELQMSNSELVTLCKETAKLPHKGKIIFICDADDTTKTKDLYIEGKSYKSWGNNVFSFQIPTPEHRKGQAVSIEHYYTDDEIRTKKTINNKECRLFLGKEFDSRGISKDGKYVCADKKACGEGKITIIEGDSKSRVTLIEDENKTVALSKMAFAEAILNEEGDFAKISSESFSLIFDVLLEIIAPGSDKSTGTTDSADTGSQTPQQSTP